MPKVFIESLGRGYGPALAMGMRFVGAEATLRPGVRVAIKPNLTFPHFRPGVMTSREAIEAVVAFLKEHTNRITICEADSGGYNRFAMEEVFRATGLDELARRYDVTLCNLSRVPVRRFGVRTGWRRLVVPLPAPILEETDLLVTMPVPKVHANTVLSGAMKNQWGLIPHPEVRLRLHPYLNAVLWELHQVLPKTIVVMDGRWGLNRNGPMRGEAVALDWLLASDDVLAADLAMAQLLGFAAQQVPHLRYACRRRGWQRSVALECNRELSEFCRQRFCLERAWTDLPGRVAFRWPAAAWLAYRSPLAAPLHRLLYLVREPFY
jgi:uncharacterized protein (DUF362 family)